MKKILILILIYFTQNVFSQIKTAETISCSCTPCQEVNKEDCIYTSADIDVKPEFPGGMKELQLFIKKNYKTPEVVGFKGKIYMGFVVEKDGSLTNIIVIRDIGYGTGKEAIRVLKTSPKWISGKQNGKPVRVHYSIPIPINQ